MEVIFFLLMEFFYLGDFLIDNNILFFLFFGEWYNQKFWRGDFNYTSKKHLSIIL